MRKPHWGRDEETPSSCSRFRYQRLRNSRYSLQILDTRMGLLIIIVLPATCLVEKLSCTHMINRIYHHITEVTRESHLSGVTMICKPRRGFQSSRKFLSPMRIYPLILTHCWFSKLQGVFSPPIFFRNAENSKGKVSLIKSTASAIFALQVLVFLI